MQTKTENIVEFKKSDAKKQIVFGEVYVPDRKDTDGNFMTAETIEKTFSETKFSYGIENYITRILIKKFL